MKVLNKALRVSAPSTFVRNTMISLNGMSRLFTHQDRYFHFTSLKSANMTDEIFKDPKSEDQLGCYMSPPDFEKWYDWVLGEIGITRKEDRASLDKMFSHVGGPEDIEEIDDIHGFYNIGIKGQNIVSKVKDVSGWKEKGEDQIETITYGPETAMPFARVGGFVRNVLYACTKAEVKRNLSHLSEFKKKMGKGSGKVASLLQYHDGPLGVSFDALNATLEYLGGTPLTDTELQDEKMIEKVLTPFLEKILPGSSKDYKINMKKKWVEANVITTSHSSILVDFPMADASRGLIGFEVGRTNATYVEGRLVINTREQVIDAAVWQVMNLPRILNQDLPPTIEDFEKKFPDMELTPDNFYKINNRCALEDLRDEDNLPLEGVPNLLDIEKLDGKTSLYTSVGTPLAVKTAEVSAAEKIVYIGLFLVGTRPWHSLRFGGYYAHDALTGQARACELAVPMGADFGGIPLHKFIPTFRNLPAYDFSQMGRELIYESNLYSEMFLKHSSESPVMYSKKSAKDYLDWASNTYTSMQMFFMVEEAVKKREEAEKTLKTPNAETVKLRQELDVKTKNLTRRYQHVWCIYDYLILASVRVFGIEFLIDEDESDKITKDSITSGAVAKRTSRFLDIGLRLTKERIKYFESQGIKNPVGLPDLMPETEEELGTVLAEQVSLYTAYEALKRLEALQKQLDEGN